MNGIFSQCPFTEFYIISSLDETRKIVFTFILNEGFHLLGFGFLKLQNRVMKLGYSDSI